MKEKKKSYTQMCVLSDEAEVFLRLKYFSEKLPFSQKPTTSEGVVSPNVFPINSSPLLITE